LRQRLHRPQRRDCEHGLTQEKLAELGDLNWRTVQKIEAGQLNVLITTVARLKKALGCRWEELMEG
jgi:DNA-binding XRE family transcriptional regulator